MTLSMDPGTLVIGVSLADGRVCAVHIRSSRLIGLSRIFLGRPADEAPILAERIFTLCGFSHAVAAQLAIGTAQGQKWSAPALFSWAIGLFAERIAETLRGCILGWPQSRGVQRRLADAVGPLRVTLSCARELMASARAGSCQAKRADLLPIAEHLAEAMEALGLLRGAADQLAPRGIFAAMMSEAAREETFLLRAPDSLSQADDARVAATLHSAGAAFASLPALPGRIIETGAYARRWHEVDQTITALAARLWTRVIDVCEARDNLMQGLAIGEIDNASLVNASRIGSSPAALEQADLGLSGTRAAFAALESPRGRLYHSVSLAPDGRIDAYHLLAPTEWNFHPAGPFVASLLGARLCASATASLRIARLAALFDPCIAFRIDCEEAGHA